MWTDNDYARRVRSEPEFYLPRILGGKLAVLVVILLLYLCIRDQLIRHMNPSAVNLGLAHAGAVILLTVSGDGDAITTFQYGHRYYDLTRHMVAHGDLFVRCWRAMLWEIERGTICAVLLVWAPPFVRLGAHAVWDLWNPPLPELRPAEPVHQRLPEHYVAALPPPPFVPLSTAGEPQEEPDRAVHPGPPDAPALPGPEVRKRPRKAKKVNPSEVDTTPPPTPPSPPIMEPGQVRKRRKPEG